MAKASRKKSYAQETSEKGAFATFWGQKWGLSIYPAYKIDKIKFSFIKIGQSGDGFDVYMDTIKDGATCFSNWAEDIVSGIMFKILGQEKQAGEQYPKEYKFSTGDNAEKSVGICNSKSGGYLVNASAPSKEGNTKEFANVQIGRGDLIRLATRFKDTYGTRMAELNAIMLEAASKYKSNAEDQADVPKADPAPAPAEKAEEKPATQKQETAPAPAEEKKQEYELKLRSTTPMTAAKKGDDLYIQAKTQDGEEKTVRFRKKVFDSVDPKLWGAFMKKTQKEGCTFTGRFNDGPKGVIDFLGFPA